MTRVGRPPSCQCGECAKCKHNAAQRERYARLTPEQKADRLASRDPERVREINRQAYYRNWDERRERGRAQGRDYYLRNRASILAKQRESRRVKREQYKAREVVATEIRAGRMVRLPCEVCGDGATQAHHDDYSKPLDVRWLCTKHHGEEHRMEKGFIGKREDAPAESSGDSGDMF